MTILSPELQAELNDIYLQEKYAVRQMLQLALQQGFCLRDLTRLAEKYRISASILEKHDGNYCVRYANGDGFFHRRFYHDKQQALSFMTTFDLCAPEQYQ
ncbi:hypothetical protein [Citrobacter amalonaticus]|uniref:hypothetical protein n=1 Tax=Citrobacter amalonaticus TaxID=35703 RepID=UPI00300D590E